jgi:uncharacterized protein YbjT (DUF2867 family)
MEAWVSGATGLVGRLLVGELSARPEVQSVTALVRRVEGRALPKLEERVVSFERLDLELAGRTATHVFCCLGTTMAKAGSEAAFRKIDYDYPLAFGRAALAAGARKFLIVTALGADPSSRIFYNRVKGEVERDLAALGLAELHVFRPSLILGERSERRLKERLTMGAAKPLGALFVGPLKRYRPIEAANIARAMVNVAVSQKPAGALSIYESDRIATLGGTSLAGAAPNDGTAVR